MGTDRMVQPNTHRPVAAYELGPSMTSRPDNEYRVCLVHERFTELGGSEKVADAMAALWPDAHLFAPLIDPAVPSLALETLSQHDSRLLRLLYPGSGRYAHLLPLLPMAMRRANLPVTDVVVVSHHAFANRVRVDAGVPIVSYVHTPARWLWCAETRAMDASSAVQRSLLTAFSASQRQRDRRAAQRPDVMVANSSTVAERIKTWWGRDATVVHPPVAVHRYRLDASVEREPFFLLAGRLVPYKRPDIAIRAATEAGVPLVVAGDGRFRAMCESIAGPNVTFVGATSDAELMLLYQRCRALIFTGVEDFGIVPVEAQACGAPVVGLDQGGLRETVIPARTGMLVAPSDDSDRQVEAFAEAMVRFRANDFDPRTIRENAERFGEDRFRAEMKAIVDELVGARRPVRLAA